MVALLLNHPTRFRLKCQHFLHLFKFKPPCLADRQHPLQNLPNSRTNLPWKPQRLAHDGTEQIFLVFSSPRQTSKDKLVKNNPQRPDVAFVRILNSLQNLRRHVVGCTHMRPQQLPSFLQLRHPEVSQLQIPIFQQNICRF